MRGLCPSASKQFPTITLLAAIACALSLNQPSSAQQQAAPMAPSPLVTQPVDETQRTVLKGNTHPLARPEFDLGTAPAALPTQRMLLVLKRSPGQESALRQLLDNQQAKSSPSYHKWLTPAEFGKQFGPTDADMQTITAWLELHGFQVGSTKGRTVLEFSGSASQVQEAFHTTIHKYMVNGEQHWANSSDPSIPTALTPAVAGVLTLHNFLKKPQIRIAKEPVRAKIRPGKSPALTLSGGIHALSPQDYATIYNINPVYNSIGPGFEITIGVIGRSNLYNGPLNDTPGQDILNFREDFGLYTVGSTLNFQVVLNGPDPGDLGGAEEAEATLDATWSGAVAYGSMVDLVVSASTNTTDGIDLSELYIIENNFANVMTESFSSCEAVSTSAEAAGYSGLAEQAAAQGISYFVSTGDNGAEGCDDQDSETVATGPLSVNVLASTPFNTAVGGTVLNENGNPSAYWSSTNTNQESAISYIPEDVWNDSCPASSCGSKANIVAGSGGASIFFSKPSWQAGVTGIVDDNARDVPDVSLTASGAHDGYVLCLEGSCVPNAQGEFLIYLVGGTSASTPSFAGIMALVDSYPGSLLQGLPNYVLYRLAASQNASIAQCDGSRTSGLPASTCIFNDVTVGNNAVPGELNYGLGAADYQAGVGYDMASGLGSVNVANLVNQWYAEELAGTSTQLLLNNGNSVNISHGQSVSVNITVSTGPSPLPVAPTGNVSLLAASGNRFETLSDVLGFFTLSGTGTVLSSTNQLPGGGPYNVEAFYAGDANYFHSESNLVLVTVTPETSATSLSGPYTLDQFGQWTTFISTPQPFGTPVFVSAAVGGGSGFGTPTGTVTFTSLSGSIPNGASPTLNSQGTTSVQSNPLIVNGPTLPFDAGQYSISASYTGDQSFQPSSSKQPVSFTIQPGFFATVPRTQPAVTISAPGSSGSTSLSVTSSTGFSGTISLSCSALPTGASCQFSPSSITTAGSLATTSSTITVTTMAATAMLRSPVRPYLAHWLAAGGFAFFSIVLVGGSRKRWPLQLLIPLLLLIALVPACGGGAGGSSNQSPPANSGTPKGTYNIVVSASSGSTTSTTSFTLAVQ
jgi:Pro-kumamolisin, activation domain/Bacterial Ig-like domain (group 3)